MSCNHGFIFRARCSGIGSCVASIAGPRRSAAFLYWRSDGQAVASPHGGDLSMTVRIFQMAIMSPSAG
jgi:hypothetical protein